MTLKTAPVPFAPPASCRAVEITVAALDQLSLGIGAVGVDRASSWLLAVDGANR